MRYVPVGLNRLAPLLVAGWLACVGLRAEELPAAHIAAAEAENAVRIQGDAKPCLAKGARGGLGVQLAEGSEHAVVYLQARVATQGVYRLWVRVRAEKRIELQASLNGGAYAPCYLEGKGQWAWVAPERTLWQCKAGRQNVALRSAVGAVLIDRAVLVLSRTYTPTGLGPVGSLTVPAREVFFVDHFQRAEDDTSAWTAATGTWGITKFFDKTDPKRASNAFIYEGHGCDIEPGIAVTGELVWRDYTGEVSVSTEAGTGTFGVVFNYVDPKNYYRAVFDAQPRGGRARLERVRQGKAEVLSERPGWLRPRQFYRVSVETLAGHFTVRVDGHAILEAKDTAFLAGRFGLLAESMAGVYFDDVAVRSLRYAAFDFSSGIDPALWHADHGFAGSAEGIKTTGEPARLAGGITAGMKRQDLHSTLHLMRTGEEDWSNYTVRATLQQPPRCQAGLVAGLHKDGAGIALLRVDRGAGLGAVYLLKALGPTPKVLARQERREPAGPRQLHLSVYYGVVSADADGKPLFEAYVGEKKTQGQAGVAAEGSGCQFSDVSVRFGQKAPSAVAANPIFLKDRYMKNWASIGGEWELSADNHQAWHRRDLYGNSSITYDLARSLPSKGALNLMLNGDGKDKDSGYRLRVAAAEGAELNPEEVKVSLFRQGQVVAEAPWTLIAHDANADEGLSGSERHGLEVKARFSLARWGAYVVARQEEEDILVWRDAEPLAGLRCGLLGEGGGVDVNRIRVSSDQLFNDTFMLAPIHWRRAQGDWRMKNRFWCAPQWSWYGGRSKECAAVWQKDAFPGDFTVDAYMSMQMDTRGAPHYFRPGYQNLTVCGDGVNLDSGYSLVYGVDHGRASRLMRRGKVVAENTDPIATPPPVWEAWQPMEKLHRRWWHWRCEKRGARLRWYLDGELLFDYTDPQPLPGSRIALWTEHRGIMVARARVSYDRKGPREFPLLPNPEPGLPEPATAPPRVTSETVAYRDDFNATRGAWTATGRENSARVRRVWRLPDKPGDGCLRMRNAISGGDCGVRCQLPVAVDVLRYPWLRLDARIDADARINLYCKTRNHWFALRLTGHANDVDTDLMIDPKTNHQPGQGTQLVRVAGTFPGVQANGNWQTLRVNLGDSLLHAMAADTLRPPSSLLVDELFLGNLEITDLSQSGFNYNHQETTYAIDNVELVRATDAQQQKAPVICARGPVQGDGRLRLQVAPEPGMPWIDVKRLALTLPKPGGGVTTYGYEALHPVMRVRPALGEIDVDLNALHAPPLTGETLALQVKQLGWRGKATTHDVDLTVPLALAQNLKPPRVFFVEAPGQTPLLKQDFALPFERWTDSRTLCAWDSEGAPHNPGSRRILSLTAAAPMRGLDLLPSFDLFKYPILSCWVRAEHGVRVDFEARVGGEPRGVAFLNKGSGMPNTPLERLTGQEDNAWHPVVMNLGQDFCRTTAWARDATVQSLNLQDFGWHGAADGMNFWVDRVRAYPFLKADAQGTLRLNLRVSDVNRVQAVRYVLTPLTAEAPTLTGEKAGPGVTEKPGTDQTVSIELHGLASGAHALHWAAKTAAGWGQAPVYYLALDTTKPVLAEQHPGQDQKDAPAAVRCVLRDQGFGVRPDTLCLHVSGKTYRATPNASLRYIPASGALILDTAQTSRQARGAFGDDGETIRMKLEAEDLAGNAVSRSWSWIMDYSKDKTPPPVPSVSLIPAKGYALLPHAPKANQLPFTHDPRQCRLRIHKDELIRRPVLQIDCVRHRASGAVTVHEGAIDLRQGLYLRFRWRVYGRFVADFRFHVGKKVYVLRFLDNHNYEAKPFGSLPNIRRDDQWHAAAFDVGAALLKVLPKGEEPTVSRVELGKPKSNRNRPGWWLRLEDFALYGTQHLLDGVDVCWDPVQDPTGVTYALAVDDKEKSTPGDGYAADRLRERLSAWPAGAVVHVAARDGAGNTNVAHVRLPAQPAAPNPVPLAAPATPPAPPGAAPAR